MICFLFNNEVITITDERADLTVLNYLREYQGAFGTKEGCASGDCGACTVVTANLSTNGNSLNYRSINSCITFMSALHGKQLIVVEHLSSKGNLHPVQQAMVNEHASQCGFCTPGFVMSMFALYHQPYQIDRSATIQALSGNLCRCTGYRPIIDAAINACKGQTHDQFDAQQHLTINKLSQIVNNTNAGTAQLLMPTNRQQLALFRKQYPDALLLAGSTDLALEFTQQLKPLEQMISLTGVKELLTISHDDTYLNIGAACSLSDITPALIQHFPSLAELIERFASLPVRNQATMGGNVANASPIGDLPPVLLALNARIVCDNGVNNREIKAEDFFQGYRKTALAKNEWIAAIKIPLLQKHTIVKAYKISKRYEDDISAVCTVFKLMLNSDGEVISLSTGFGGVAATPLPCKSLQCAMEKRTWNHADNVSLGSDILTHAFSPLDDVRASAAYRNQILGNMWHRFWLETNAEVNTIDTRVVHHA